MTRSRWVLGIGIGLVAVGVATRMVFVASSARTPTSASALVRSASPAPHRPRSDASGGATASRSSGGLGAPVAPNGTFLAASGHTETLASFRGRPVLVWFIAGGCASCAVSIPAVARHFGELRADGVTVLSLGLSNDFAAGTKGLANLLDFAHAAGGAAVSRPGWEWGLASTSLAVAYDLPGTPDVYALIGPRGHIRYRGSVPVSTMPALLRAARALRSH